MTLKAVICEYPAQVWMIFEENSKQIPCFSFVPISTSEHRRSARHRIRLSSVSLDPDPPRVAWTNAQQMIDHLETLLSFRVIHATNIYDALELALRVVSKKGEDWNHSRGRDVQSQFVFQDRELLDKFWEALN